MGARTLHDLIRSAELSARSLRHYRIKPAGEGVLLWRYSGGWMMVHHFTTAEAAEDYLVRKLRQVGEDR